MYDVLSTVKGYRVQPRWSSIFRRFYGVVEASLAGSGRIWFLDVVFHFAFLPPPPFLIVAKCGVNTTSLTI